MKELQPINQKVLIDITDAKAETQTASGIYIPDSAKAKKQIGTVKAISNIENPEIAVGDIVIYKEFSGSEVKFEGKDYLLIPYEDVLAKIVEMDTI